MAILKLVLLAIVLLGIGVAGFAIKLFVQKDTTSINTSCGAVDGELQKKGVSACVTESCSNEQIEICKSEGKVEAKPMDLM